MHKGSLVLSHTFEEPEFLARTISAGRQYGVKLTALLQAALMQAVYNSADVKPSSKEEYNNTSAIDLRTNTLIAPFNERNVYVNLAVAVENIKIPCKLFEINDFWSIASHIAGQWMAIKDKGTSSITGEIIAQTMLKSMMSSR
jgi:hypothetical protein